MEGETKLCTNCKRDITAANFVMHEMHCRRHIVLCEKCDEPIPRSEAEQHFNDVHQKVPCELCKVEIAKDKMDDHMDNVCPKKQLMCEYCELSVSKDSIEAHIDYCGSRTEPCALCQQYIMLKDMTQHELSGCKYPEPKPVPSNQTAAQSDPFSMSYLQEFLDTDFGRVGGHMPDLYGRELRRGRDKPLRGGNTSNRNRSTQQASRVRQAARNKSNVNSQRERDSVNSFPGNLDIDGIPPDMDYDTMLAVQLSHEDMVNQDGVVNVERNEGIDNNDLNYDWQHFSDDNIDTDIQTPPEQHLNVEDADMTIPCEFCNLEIPIDMYMEHTAYCQQGETNGLDPASTSEPRDRNNTVPIFESHRPTIPVIDNLHHSDHINRRHTDDSPPDHTNQDEDYCLPCEFCDEMYPSEMFLQHQVVCPMNSTATPRVTTPASGFRSSKKRDKDNQVRAAKHNFSSTTFTASFNDEQQGEADSDDGPKSNFFRDESYKTSLQSSSDKYGESAVPRFDEASIRASNRSSRRYSQDRDTEEDVALPRNYEPVRPNKSARRTRATLDQLLQDNEDIGSQAGTSSHHRNQGVNNHRRRGAASTTANNTTGSRSTGTSISTRTVFRALERESGAGAGAGASSGSRPRRINVRVPQTITTSSYNDQTSPVIRSRVNNSTNTTNTTNTTSTSTRNRQRSDHIFSPELRPKPNDNRRR